MRKKKRKKTKEGRYKVHRDNHVEGARGNERKKTNRRKEAAPQRMRQTTDKGRKEKRVYRSDGEMLLIRYAAGRPKARRTGFGTLTGKKMSRKERPTGQQKKKEKKKEKKKKKKKERKKKKKKKKNQKKRKKQTRL